MRFANDFHSWLRHSWKLLANRLTRDPKIVIHGNSCIILYIICADNGLVPSRQCWNIVNWTLRNKLQWNLNWNSHIFIQGNVFENIIWKMAAILSQPQSVKQVQLWLDWQPLIFNVQKQPLIYKKKQELLQSHQHANIQIRQNVVIHHNDVKTSQIDVWNHQPHDCLVNCLFKVQI